MHHDRKINYDLVQILTLNCANILSCVMLINCVCSYILIVQSSEPDTCLSLHLLSIKMEWASESLILHPGSCVEGVGRGSTVTSVKTLNTHVLIGCCQHVGRDEKYWSHWHAIVIYPLTKQDVVFLCLFGQKWHDVRAIEADFWTRLPCN